MMQNDNVGHPIVTDLPTSVRIDEGSLTSDSIDEFTFEDKKPLSSCYTPFLSGCCCFGAFKDGMCGKLTNYEDISTRQENVFLLSTSYGLSEE